MERPRIEDAAEEKRHRYAANMVWLVRLRWVAVAGQLATVLFVELLLELRLPVAPLLSIVGFTASTNGVLAIWLRIARPSRGDAGEFWASLLLPAVMTLDLFALTALLYFSGGPANPFTVFYLVNLALAAVVLPSRWGWTLTVIAVVCLAGLFVQHTPLPALQELMEETSGGSSLNLLLAGRFAALSMCACVVMYFITRVNEELRRREGELRLAEEQRARSERLEALATLAAGAGHELASPLSTIAVVSKDLTRHLQGADVPPSVIEDVRLIRSELDHCRSILDRLSTNVGHAAGEELSPVAISRLVDEVVSGLRHSERIRLAIDPRAGSQSVLAPLQGLAQAVRGVVQNALDATEPHGVIDVSAHCDAGRVCLRVRDNGPGMSAEVLARAGEPFFTTKEPGKGMGLGLFLTRGVIERLGGAFRLQSKPGEGATAIVELPIVDDQ